ncbi:hypothetical protein RRG08_042471 [Elysia crispata]|uniref:CCHC-type domain-containing protein n=1 Tax=Elysia crispata TaxID=231223 RepID=A0AAE1DEP3_9GAST|nr:hypothetical protein RRG08_042471 [Elysia crispata]
MGHHDSHTRHVMRVFLIPKQRPPRSNNYSNSGRDNNGFNNNMSQLKSYRSNRSDQCFACGKPGHFAAHCDQHRRGGPSWQNSSQPQQPHSGNMHLQ